MRACLVPYLLSALGLALLSACGRADMIATPELSDAPAAVEDEPQESLDAEPIDPCAVTSADQPPPCLSFEEQRPKDIIFALDTSLSMYRNDPVVGNTCGRMIAVQKIAEALEDSGDYRFGLLTFAGQALNTSSGLEPHFYSLKAALDSRYNIGATRIVCAAALGTNFEHAFAGARNLLQKYSSAEREQIVVLITDGKPNLTLRGEAVADGLKSVDVTIMTVLSHGRSDILKERIASYGDDGQALHFELTNTQELIEALR